MVFLWFSYGFPKHQPTVGHLQPEGESGLEAIPGSVLWWSTAPGYGPEFLGDLPSLWRHPNGISMDRTQYKPMGFRHGDLIREMMKLRVFLPEMDLWFRGLRKTLSRQTHHFCREKDRPLRVHQPHGSHGPCLLFIQNGGSVWGNKLCLCAFALLERTKSEQRLQHSESTPDE